jgi:hypothetical protein
MKREHHHRTPTEKEQVDGWGREEVQGKRGRRRRWIGGAGERRRKKRTCFSEASRQFAYFNEVIIFLKNIYII